MGAPIEEETVDDFLPTLPDVPSLQPVIVPVSAEAICPTCGAHQGMDLEEDIYGGFGVAEEDRYGVCECGELLDLGWFRFPWGNPA